MTVFRLLLPVVSLYICVHVAPAGADETWVLWERPLDLNGQKHGEWHRGPVFDRERWCKGAMTTAINQALTELGKKESKGKASEYQCLPGNVDPRAAPDKKR